MAVNLRSEATSSMGFDNAEQQKDEPLISLAGSNYSKDSLVAEHFHMACIVKLLNDIYHMLRITTAITVSLTFSWNP